MFDICLRNANLLYLHTSVLILLDRAYISRFWTSFEAYLSMRRASENGLDDMEKPLSRTSVRLLYDADEALETSLIKDWAKCTPEKAKAKLSGADFDVTNNGDKKIQLDKIDKLAERTQRAMRESRAESAPPMPHHDGLSEDPTGDAAGSASAHTEPMVLPPSKNLPPPSPPAGSSPSPWDVYPSPPPSPSAYVELFDDEHTHTHDEEEARCCDFQEPCTGATQHALMGELTPEMALELRAVEEVNQAMIEEILLESLLQLIVISRNEWLLANEQKAQLDSMFWVTSVISIFMIVCHGWLYGWTLLSSRCAAGRVWKAEEREIGHREIGRSCCSTEHAGHFCLWRLAAFQVPYMPINRVQRQMYDKYDNWVRTGDPEKKLSLRRESSRRSMTLGVVSDDGTSLAAVATCFLSALAYVAALCERLFTWTRCICHDVPGDLLSA